MDEWEDVKGRRPPPNKSFVVHITASHLARGERGNIFSDAPALAVKEQIPQVKWAMVGWGYATTGDYDGRKRYWNVHEWHAFVAWMRAYDYGKNPPPSEFTFILDGQREEKPTGNAKPRRFRTFYDEEARRAAKTRKS